MSPLPQATLGPLDARFSAFRALATQVHSLATPHNFVIEMTAQPEAAGNMVISSAPILLQATLPAQLADGEYTLHYGNPFVAGLREHARAMAFFRAALPLPQGGTVTAQAVVAQGGAVTRLTDGPLTPRLTPPRNVQVAGHGPTESPAGVGVSPLLTWEPPQVGVPDRYKLFLYKVEQPAGGGEPTLTPLHTLVTAETSARFRQGLLESGSTYVVLVQAQRGLGDKALTQPWVDPFDSDSAIALSGAFEP